jgi:hypothetical protein
MVRDLRVLSLGGFLRGYAGVKKGLSVRRRCLSDGAIGRSGGKWCPVPSVTQHWSDRGAVAPEACRPRN